MSDVDCLFVNTITLMLVVDRRYDVINGMTILYLTYWTFAHMDVAFANHMQFFKVV